MDTPNSSSKWRPVNKERPCAICGKHDRCKLADGVAWCWRFVDPPAGYERVKLGRNGGAMFRREGDGNGRESFTPRRSAQAAKPDAPRNWQAECERFTAVITPEQRQELAAQLVVTADSLAAVGVGLAKGADLAALHARWEGDAPELAYTFPERDANGRVIGLSLRAPDGRKSSPSGAKRGLIVPSTLATRPDPVLCVEGASDVAACEVLGLKAVGRPSNSGGAEYLAKLLKRRTVLIIGENDGKDSGAWPGRDGADAVAERLAQEWETPVAVAFPPTGFKDIRAWLQSRVKAGLYLADADACRAAGAELSAALQASAAAAKPGKKPTAAQRLVKLTDDAQLWHTPDGEPYATIPVGGHLETHHVRARGFRLWIVERWYRNGGGAPNQEALQRAILNAEARARFDGPELVAHVRVADHEGAIWLDLADAEWRCVRIDADGWTIADDPPVRFRRPRGMRPLPEPMRGGDIRELGKLLHLDGDALSLASAWQLAALRPSGPYPVLAIHGPQGAGKSVTTRVLRALVDPAEPLTRTIPRDERDLAIAADNSRVLAFDNLSGLPVWLSDALCRVATGGGLATRELYENREETIFSATRPVILNGIEDVATRPDLLDRCIVLQLSALSDAVRRPESELLAQFEAARPRLLGALLDGVSAALRNVSSVKLDATPRMADFAAWAVAGETGLGFKTGTILAEYRGNRADANSLAIESTPVAGALIDFIEAVGGWTGTATALLAELDSRATDAVRKARAWPKTPRGLTGTLRRLAPNLAACGVGLTFERTAGGNRERIIRAESRCNQSSQPSLSSHDSPDVGKNAVGGVSDRDGRDANELGRDDDAGGDRPTETRPGAVETAIRDGRDGRDGGLLTDSGGGVPDGWTPDGWLRELRRKAAACEAVDPARAAELREKAARIERTGRAEPLPAVERRQGDVSKRSPIHARRADEYHFSHSRGAGVGRRPGAAPKAAERTVNRGENLPTTLDEADA